MSRNRRRHPRVRGKGLAAHLRSERGRTPCIVENISAGGMFVRTDKLEPVGYELFIDLVKPGWKRALTLPARVTSRIDSLAGHITNTPPGMGMQFLRIEDEQHDRLLRLLRDLGAPEEEKPAAAGIDLVEDATSLDLQHAPLWQQVQMVEEEITHALEAEEVGPLDPALFEKPKAPPPPAPASKPPPGGDAEVAKLQLQLRGLVMQLSDAQQQLAQRDAEIERLREELETLRQRKT